MSEKTDRAGAMFSSGFNCAQSVFAVFCGKYGLDEAAALKIACGLGGGCRSGEICGAASGGALVLGLRDGHCEASDSASKTHCYEQTARFMRRFREENGALTCRDILGCDVSTPEGMERAREIKLFSTLCPDAIKNAVGILEELGY